ncbi:MAG: hypothetical protein WC632_03410 [Candidatus Margulisiibacteriota bacterium]
MTTVIIKTGRTWFLLALLVGGLLQPLGAETYESLSIINSKNWADYIGNHLGFLYDSHGCLHFTPSDIYLLTKTVPKGSKLAIKEYRDRQLPDNYRSVPFFRAQVNTADDVRKYAGTFQAGDTRLVVYPGLGQLFILVDDKPLVKVKTMPGPAENYRLVFAANNKNGISWDSSLSTPTDAGNYSILGSTAHYLSYTYRDITIVPWGGWLLKQKGHWVFQDDNNKWYQAPAFIGSDLEQPYGRQDNNYFDINVDKSGRITAARWGSNDFGKYALMWTTDGRNRYPELGYAEGQLLFEQTILVKDLADLLTMPGADSLKDCIDRNENFGVYRDVYNFLLSRGERAFDQLDPVSCSYVRLFNGFRLSEADQANIDKQAWQAFNDYRAGKLPARPADRQRTIGLYAFIRDYDLVFDKNAGWYAMVKDDWDFFSDLRAKLRRDYNKYGLYSPANRMLAVEKFLSDRLEFRQVSPPAPPKERLSVADFYRTEDEPSLYTLREKNALRALIRSAAAGEKTGVALASVKALNNYNFGLLLNEMLGDLYKSHGCFHVSPLNVYILNKTLPVGTRITVRPFADQADPALSKLPLLASLVNFTDDFSRLAEQFADPAATKVVIFPGSRLWVIYLKEVPFARMKIESGFRAKVNILQGRDKQGRPLFEKEIAYPSPPGTFYVLKKLTNYVSNLYYDTTIVPQGAQLKRAGDKWVFQDENGRWRNAPDVIQDDLNASLEKRAYEYYDLARDGSGRLLRAKWGSNTFGKYQLLLSADQRTPSPELVHTTGDLMMEQRRLIGNLIKVMTATRESFDDCVKASGSFDLYTTCYQFIQNPNRTDLIEPLESGCYKLYLELPLNDDEKAALPPEIFACYKVDKGQAALTAEETDLLTKEGLAKWQGGKLQIDEAKVYGVLYDLYQYVVAIRKNANIYSTFKDHWGELSELRQALLQDFNKFMIKDPVVLREFIRELILERAELKKLTRSEAYQTLDQLLEDDK